MSYIFKMAYLSTYKIIVKVHFFLLRLKKDPLSIFNKKSVKSVPKGDVRNKMYEPRCFDYQCITKLNCTVYFISIPNRFDSF